MKILKVLILIVSLNLLWAVDYSSEFDKFKPPRSLLNSQANHKAKRGGAHGFVSQAPGFSPSDTEILDSIFGTLEVAARTLPEYEQEPSIIAETLSILGVESVDQRGNMNIAVTAGPLTIQYSLGSIQDSFMNLNTFNMPKKHYNTPTPQEAKLMKGIMTDVWADMVREMGGDLNKIPTNEEKPQRNEDVKADPINLIEVKENSDSSTGVPEDKITSSFSLLGVVGFGSLMVVAIFVGMVMLNRRRKPEKRERFDDEKIPLSSKGTKIL